MKTVLVTGAYGFLGRNIAAAFKSMGWRVLAVGHGEWSSDEYRGFGINQWVRSDITLEALNLFPGDIDLIVHCAGSGSVGYSLQQPMDDFQKTVDSTLAVLEYMRLHQPAAKLVYPSSAAVYGQQDNRPIREDEPLTPVSPYGCHKKIAEELCASYAGSFGLNITIVRFFSIYGEGLRKQLLWDACARLASETGKLEFFGTGEETRDWLHISDAVSLIALLARTGDSFVIINGAGGVKVTIREILTTLARQFGRTEPICFNGAGRPGDPHFYHADITRALNLGWKPSVFLAEGAASYVRWFKECR